MSLKVSPEFPVGLDVNWEPSDKVALSDPYLKNWLLDTGSLTERVQALCRHFSLVKLGQGTKALHASETALLNATANSEWQVREVLLCADNEPWVYARSVIPQSLIDDELANLGTEPLGKRLFNDPRFARSDFHLCQATPEALSRLNMDITDTLWGRRSLFSFQESRMIVAEVFLPDAPAYESRYRYGR
ncbi:chorismate--pyruvate lyase family protein [Alteromonas sp. H39]|uniref:chorismate--pyruvate lyase family protein n=1 Tax=Alteromonas sp. H39 TaxID=3389876 RepID=UPI0039E0970D